MRTRTNTAGSTVARAAAGLAAGTLLLGGCGSSRTTHVDTSIFDTTSVTSDGRLRLAAGDELGEMLYGTANTDSLGEERFASRGRAPTLIISGVDVD